MKDWILVYWTISSRYEKYHRDILLKNLVDEKVAVLIVEFLLDLYVSETSKGDSWCLGTLERKTRTSVCLSVQEISALLQGRCWLSETGNLKSFAIASVPISPLTDEPWMQTTLIIHVSGRTVPMGLHIELVCAFICCCVLFKHNFIKIGMLI